MGSDQVVEYPGRSRSKVELRTREETMFGFLSRATAGAMSSSFATASRQRIATIDDSITSSLVRAGVRRKVQIQALYFTNMSLSTKWCHSIGFILYSRSSTHLGVEEAGRDDIDSGKVPPFACERSAKVSDSGFGSVVDLLLLVVISVCEVWRLLVDRWER